jgi:hypothetical protein
MNKIDPKLRDKFVSTTNEVKNFIPLASDISVEQARTIIKYYTAAIEGNFLSWMGGASISALSLVSRFAADENLWVELKDDHPSMLCNFAKCCKGEPNSKDFQYIHNEVLEIRNMVGEMSGLKNITLMATLENTSVVFIPLLSELAQKLGYKDLSYTNVHGAADIEHADQFLEALTDEQIQGYYNYEKDIDSTINLTLKLLNKCFVL